MNETQEDVYQEMKHLTRGRMRLVWEMARLGAAPSEEDALLVRIMREHGEYSDLWGRLDELADEEIERDGVDPVLHVTIHQTIENQIADGDPKEVHQVVQRLILQGLSRHEAVHRVGSVLTDEIYHILRDERPFDEAGYVRKLQRLVKSKKGVHRRRR